MQATKELFNLEKYTKPTTKANSQRAELIEQFLVRLNQAREGTKYKPLTPQALAVKLAHVPTEHLYPFLKDCERAKNFSAYFFWALKPENCTQNLTQQ